MHKVSNDVNFRENVQTRLKAIIVDEKTPLIWKRASIITPLKRQIIKRLLKNGRTRISRRFILIDCAPFI